MNKKSPKADKIRAYFKKNPEARALDAALATKCDLGYAYRVKKQMQNESAARAVKAFDEKPAAPRSGNKPLTHDELRTELQAVWDAPEEKLALELTMGQILDERGSRYGKFIEHAMLTQLMKGVVTTYLQQHNKTLMPDQQEALDMIFHKIGRIVNGDPNYVDSWIDIAGYATLVADRLEGKVR